MKRYVLGGPKIAVALSSGADSMALLYLLHKEKNQGHYEELRAIHINHGTRAEENVKEEKLAHDFCQKLGVPLSVIHLDMALGQSNFEDTARKLRYGAFQSTLLVGELLFLGHHIDDSFEWSLMQRGRSSELSSTIGIPLANGPMRRPLMCFTRAQIEQIVKLEEINYSTDSSNKKNNFLRNDLRNNLIPEYKKRFPQYLKHYIRQAEQMSYRLGLHRNQELSGVHHWESCLDFSKKGIIILTHPKKKNIFYGAEEVLRQSICTLSQKKRGRISEEINKLIEAAIHFKKGPMNFSGGVKVYIKRGQLIIVADGYENIAQSFLLPS